jgi:hypothetical protein
MVLHIDEDSWTSGFFFFGANFCHLVEKIKIQGNSCKEIFVKKKGAKIAIF